ncbi:basic helix-loop-helix (bHLH) DNA-binding superfamily protein [Rhynchospora pubera]|uniref:Basic helix-loop-helix (BHLH) DNA-binding superfamily protein n=1 Tax=Rhynchospora pubera TaxID=906938 RepID=A0AAV8CCX8_9POAL|nr:basic helix-loop-helix (bHLH) DNA-binding superfamily protein [Rhynchospora pubera]
MEAESSTSNQQRKRKRSASESSEKPAQSTWRSDKEHRLYSSKLLEALRRVRSGSGSSSPRTDPPRSRAVREAADRALAISARGRTRWSRAILSSRSIKLKSNRIRVPCPARPKRTELERIQSAADQEKKKSVVLQSKAKVLGRLVPGCKKLSFPTLLEEASDYIKALEMQVKAMSALTEILSMFGGGTEGAPGMVQDAGAGTSTGTDSMPPPA